MNNITQTNYSNWRPVSFVEGLATSTANVIITQINGLYVAPIRLGKVLTPQITNMIVFYLISLFT